MTLVTTGTTLLGTFLKDRRTRLDPAALGVATPRRRTPGLRREEVAQRAGVSATWYTWLEQGRGGPPSAHAVERLAAALLLTDAEREHLFLLALGRPPEVRRHAVTGVSQRLQRVLDALPLSPAIVKTATWDVLAWNRAATVLLCDYAALEPAARNVLRMMFLNPDVKARQFDWEHVARFVVATFRADATRIGATEEVEAMVDELSRGSPDFVRLWKQNEVFAHGEGTKTLRHPTAGLLGFEYSSFAVDGRPDLAMVVYNPATDADAEIVTRLLATS
jgi:transcriptional regulator with XRE-family HTH domain